MHFLMQHTYRIAPVLGKAHKVFSKRITTNISVINHNMNPYDITCSAVEISIEHYCSIFLRSKHGYRSRDRFASITFGQPALG